MDPEIDEINPSIHRGVNERERAPSSKACVGRRSHVPAAPSFDGTVVVGYQDPLSFVAVLLLQFRHPRYGYWRNRHIPPSQVLRHQIEL